MFEELKKYTLWLAVYLFVYLLAFWVFALLFSLSPFARDDTDPSQWFGSRSGMALYTDARTGCQYLSVPNSGMIPRTDRSGKHLGCN